MEQQSTLQTIREKTQTAIDIILLMVTTPCKIAYDGVVSVITAIFVRRPNNVYDTALGRTQRYHVQLDTQNNNFDNGV